MSPKLYIVEKNQAAYQLGQSDGKCNEWFESLKKLKATSILKNKSLSAFEITETIS